MGSNELHRAIGVMPATCATGARASLPVPGARRGPTRNGGSGSVAAPGSDACSARRFCLGAQLGPGACAMEWPEPGSGRRPNAVRSRGGRIRALRVRVRARNGQRDPSEPVQRLVVDGRSQVPRCALTLAGPGGLPFQGQLDLFVRGTESAIYQNAFNSSPWTGWSAVPGEGLTPAGPGPSRTDRC